MRAVWEFPKEKEQEMVDNQKCFTGELWKNEEKVWNDEKMRDRENLEDSWGETVLLSQGATKGPAVWLVWNREHWQLSIWIRN